MVGELDRLIPEMRLPANVLCLYPFIPRLPAFLASAAVLGQILPIPKIIGDLTPRVDTVWLSTSLRDGGLPETPSEVDGTTVRLGTCLVGKT